MRKPIIYIAHPYSSDPRGNYTKSLAVAVQILQIGGVPINPLESHIYNELDPHPYEFWMENDFQIIKRCDCLYRVHGKSKGADREVIRVRDCGVPVFYSIPQIEAFIERFVNS